MLEKMDIKVLERLLNAISGVLEAESEKIRAGIAEVPTPTVTDGDYKQISDEVKQIGEPKEKRPETRKFLTIRELAQLTGRKTNSIQVATNRGMIHKHPEGYDKEECCGSGTNPCWGFYVGAGRARAASDLKAWSVARKCLLEVCDLCSLEFRDGLTQNKLSCRLCRAMQHDELHTFRLGDTEFVNVSEFVQWANNWGETYHQLNKAGNTPTFHDFPEFPVHEYDLVWAMSRKYQDRILPSVEDRIALREMNIPHVTIRGYDYYKADALEAFK